MDPCFPNYSVVLIPQDEFPLLSKILVGCAVSVVALTLIGVAAVYGYRRYKRNRRRTFDFMGSTTWHVHADQPRLQAHDVIPVCVNAEASENNVALQRHVHTHL